MPRLESEVSRSLDEEIGPRLAMHDLVARNRDQTVPPDPLSGDGASRSCDSMMSQRRWEWHGAIDSQLAQRRQI